MTGLISTLTPIMAEVTLGLSGMLLMLYGAIRKADSTKFVSLVAIIIMFITGILVLAEPRTDMMPASYESLLVNNLFVRFVQFSVVMMSVAVLISTYSQLKDVNLSKPEYPVFMIFTTLGMLLVISANDLITFFIGLEMQSLPVYVMIAMGREDKQANESALKYFILGTVASIFILFGSSYIYGYAGNTDFSGIALAFSNFNEVPLPLMLALIFILAGLSFKISAVPFHMWAPDVYEGSPTPVTTFIASAPKIASMAFLVRFLFGPMGNFVESWQPIIQSLAIITMLLGVFAAFYQTNIKRLLAYSAISHMGYALVGLASASVSGVQAVLVYMILYAIMAIGIFACLMNMRHHGVLPVTINDLKGLGKTSPRMAACVAILMFSFAGIPPMAGFFGKFMVFMAAVDARQFALAVIGVLTSVVGASYYLRIVKVMYFDEPEEQIHHSASEKISRGTGVIIATAAIISMLFFMWPDPLIKMADSAASILVDIG